MLLKSVSVLTTVIHQHLLLQSNWEKFKN